MSRPTFQLTLRAESRPGDATDRDATRRLRATLKHLLRSWGWRCTRIEPVKPDGAEPIEGAEGDPDTTGNE